MIPIITIIAPYSTLHHPYDQKMKPICEFKFAFKN